MKHFLFTLVFILSSLQAVADKGGAHAGGGGGGVELENEVFLADLYEAGVHYNVLFPYDEDQAFTRSLVARGITPEVAALISKKLVELEYYDPMFVDAILQAFKLLTWFEVTSELESTADMDGYLIKEKIIQLARRDGPMVRISSAYYQRMSVRHRAALLFHEALGAIAPYQVPPKHLRSLVAIIFSSQTSNMSLDEVRALFSTVVNIDKLRPKGLGPFFYTRHISVSLQKGTDFYYEPTLYLEWEDLRSPWAQFIKKPSRETTRIMLVPFMKELTGFRYCKVKKAQLSLSTLESRHWRLVLSLPQVEPQGIQPRFIIGIKHEMDFKTYFGTQASPYKASCSAENKKELDDIFNWATTLKDF